jgi:hypothetical protein
MLDHCKEARDLALWISEPIGAPDAMQAPAEANENLMTEPVAIACRASAVIRGAVAFDPEHKATGLNWIDYPQIYPETGDTDLWHHVIAVGADHPCYRFLEWTVRLYSRYIAGGDFPVSAKCRNSRSIRVPRGDASTRISPASIDENTTQRWRAREINTLRRRSPPSADTGPKLIDIRPCASLPYPIEMNTTSRSSPCTVSRFLTNRRSPFGAECFGRAG